MSTGASVSREMMVEGMSGRMPLSTTASTRWPRCLSISMGSMWRSPCDRGTLAVMIGSPTSRTMAWQNQCSGMRTPMDFRLVWRSLGTSRVAGMMKVYGPGSRLLRMRKASLETLA